MGAIPELLESEDSRQKEQSGERKVNYSINYSERSSGEWSILNFSEYSRKKQAFPDYAATKEGEARDYHVWQVSGQDNTEFVRIEPDIEDKNELASELYTAYHERIR